MFHVLRLFFTSLANGNLFVSSSPLSFVFCAVLCVTFESKKKSSSSSSKLDNTFNVMLDYTEAVMKILKSTINSSDLYLNNLQSHVRYRQRNRI